MNKKHALTSWRAEKNSAYLYAFMAIAEKGTERETLFKNLAKGAEEQALFWEKELRRVNYPLPTFKPDFRIRFISWFLPRLGPVALKPILAAMKIRGLSVYLGDLPGHAREDAGKLEHRHWAIGSSGTIRAAVFGINDGLISNASLILGVVGASTNTSLIILTGVAGLCAGAFSMGSGEYVSMRAQRELFEYQIDLERAELEEYPEEEAEELSYIYQARGLSKIDADSFAKKLLSNKEAALHTLAREELGLNPDELGSPWGAALSSFFSFAVGGFIPLLPFILPLGEAHVSISIALTAVALFMVGVTLSLFTGRNAFYSGARMLAIGILAGATTFAIGHAIGVNI